MKKVRHERECSKRRQQRRHPIPHNHRPASSLLPPDRAAETTVVLSGAGMSRRSSYDRLKLQAMRASICDIVAAIAFGNIVYRLVAGGDATSPYGNQTDIGPLERA